MREALPLLALVALVLPALVWRAGLESSLWMDEVHSLQMAHLSAARIVDQAARDAHPPGYFLALSAWLAAGRRLGVEGLAWARGLGVVAWLALAAAVWALARRLAGRRAAGPAAWAVAGGAAAGQAAVELRGYVVVLAAAVAGFLVALVADEAAAGRRRRAAAWWALYAALAAVALWTHLLAAPLFALVGAAWMGGVAVRRSAVPGGGPRGAPAGGGGSAVTAGGASPGPTARRAARLRGRLALGLAAHLAAAVAWLPWLVHVPAQLATLSRLDTGWMTPATPSNLGLVFARWFPFGRAAAGEGWAAAMVVLGVAAVLAPLAGWRWFRARAHGPRRPAPARADAGRDGADRDEGPVPEPRGRREEPARLRPAAALAPATARQDAGGGARRLHGLRPAAALAAAAAFPLLLWCLARFDLAAVFHGPRYPTLAAGLWALALAGLAVAAARDAATMAAGAARRSAGLSAVPSPGGPPRAGAEVTSVAAAGRPATADVRRGAAPLAGVGAGPFAGIDVGSPARGVGWLPWLLLGPWLLAAAVGHLLALRQEARGGLPAARPAIEAALALPADPLYVSPTELAPFVAGSLAGLAVRPVEEVACGLVERGRAVVLDLNPWPDLERSRDRIWTRAANRGLLAADRRWHELPAPGLRATLLAMDGAGPRAPALCARRLAPPRPWTAAPAAVALPEDQLHADGWSVPELGRDLVPRRWAASPAATLRFDHSLAAGRHTLHLVAHRASAPRAVEELCVRPPGGGGESCFVEPAGRIELAVPFTLSRSMRRPAATLRHPLWSPAESLGTGDHRWLSVQLEVAWIESEGAGM